MGAGRAFFESFEVFSDLIDGFFFKRELEQSAGVTPGHSRNNRVFASHCHTRGRYQFNKPDTAAYGSATCWNP